MASHRFSHNFSRRVILKGAAALSGLQIGAPFIIRARGETPLRIGMAAKPLVLYESDDLVALASEEIAIRAIVDREIETYDPYEREVLVWKR